MSWSPDKKKVRPRAMARPDFFIRMVIRLLRNHIFSTGAFLSLSYVKFYRLSLVQRGITIRLDFRVVHKQIC